MVTVGVLVMAAFTVGVLVTVVAMGLSF